MNLDFLTEKYIYLFIYFVEIRDKLRQMHSAAVLIATTKTQFVFGLTDLISKTDISSFSDKLNANGVEMIDLHKQDFIIIM